MLSARTTQLGLICGLLILSAPVRGGRATPAQMHALREQSQGLLDDPATNYARISTLFLLGDPAECAKQLPRFETQLANAGSDRERAALHFLLAEAIANETLFGLLQDRAPKHRHPSESAQPVTEHYLAAFALATAPGGEPKLAAHIAHSFLPRIPLIVVSNPADSELRRRIIAEFIDVVEKRPALALPEKDRAAAYRALGIADRLWDALPEAPPPTKQELAAALRSAVEARCHAKAALYADAAWERHSMDPVLNSQLLLSAARALIHTPGREADGIQRLQQIAPHARDAWLDLYQHASAAKPAPSRAQQLALLDGYLKTAGIVNRHGRTTLSHHHRVAQILMAEAAYQDALRYLDMALAVPAASNADAYPSILLARGDCLAKLNRKDEAREMYKEAMVAPPSSRHSRVGYTAETRLIALEAAMQEE